MSLLPSLWKQEIIDRAENELSDLRRPEQYRRGKEDIDPQEIQSLKDVLSIIKTPSQYGVNGYAHILNEKIIEVLKLHQIITKRQAEDMMKSLEIKRIPKALEIRAKSQFSESATEYEEGEGGNNEIEPRIPDILIKRREMISSPS